MTRSNLSLGSGALAFALFAQSSTAQQAHPSPASAPTTPVSGAISEARVRDIVFAADDAYRDGRYDQAADAFDEAYLIRPQAALLFNIGKCHEKSWLITGRDSSAKSAVEAYRQYLAEVDRSSPKSRHAEAEQSLERLSPAVERNGRTPGLAPATPRAATRSTRIMIGASIVGAVARIDGSPPRPLPLLEPVQPGTHRIVVSRAEFLDEEREVIVTEGELYPVHAELRPAPGSLTVRTKAGSAIYVDGRFSAKAPLNRPLSLAPGMHDIAVVDAGRVPWGQRTEVLRASESTVDAPLRLSPYRWASFGLMGVATIAASLAVYEGTSAAVHDLWATRFLSRRAKGDVLLESGDLAAYNHDGEARDSARAQAFTYGTIASLLGLAAAGAYFMDKPSVGDVVYERSATEPSKTDNPVSPSVTTTVTPALSGTAAGIDVRIRF